MSEEHSETIACTPQNPSVAFPIVFPAEAQLKQCGQCGAELLCGPQEPYGDCWCDRMPNVMPLLSSSETCLCHACLDNAIQLRQQQSLLTTAKH